MNDSFRSFHEMEAQRGDAWGRGYGYGIGVGIAAAYFLHWLAGMWGWAGWDLIAAALAIGVVGISIARSVINAA